MSERPDSTEPTPTDVLEGKVCRHVCWYTAVVSIVTICLVVANLQCIEHYHQELTNPTDPTNGAAHYPLPPLVTLMIFAGALGGCLANIRGIVRHASNFDAHRRTTYYFSPVSAGICGLIVVVLLLGGVLTLGLAEEAKKTIFDHPSKVMPFVAVAILAGYGSAQFKHKLDELADTLFSSRRDE